MRIAKQLTLDGTIRPENIAILSPYNAQVSEISKGLLKEGIRGVTVCTIMKSQGELAGEAGVGSVLSCLPQNGSNLSQRRSLSKSYTRVISAMEEASLGQVSG